jgi:phosphoglycerate dehydrogenase-like enzyme
MYPGLDAAVLPADQRARLEALVDVVDPKPLGRFTSERALDVLGQVDVLFGHWGCPPIDEEALVAAPHLRLLAYGAGTVKGIVGPALFDRGIVVTSAAAANARPVAEFTIAAILFANKDVFGVRERLIEGDPPHTWVDRSATVGNVGKRIGVIGASMVGRLVIELLAPFDLEVVVADPHLGETEAEALGVHRVELDELMATSDVVSVHAPELPETRHLVSAERLAAMRPGAVLINTARGSLVDTQALVEQLEAGRISAVLDVTDPEPLPPGHPLLSLPNAFVTPHVAGAQGTELRRLTDLAIDEVERFTRAESPLYPVTADDLARIA